jgi:murein DD-endopeptidase MepM/ murein hydrolase activator NlpD
VGLVVPPPAAADPRGDAREASRAADRAAAILEDATVVARSAARRLEIANAALPAAQRRVAIAIGVVAAARAEANTARRKADAARAVYDQHATRYEHARQRVDQARDRVDQVAAASYMGGDFATLNVLVSATGPRDIMDRMGLVEQVVQKQQDTVVEMSAARRAARIEQDRAGLAKQAAEDAEQEAAGKLAKAQAAQVAAVQARAAVVRLAEARRQALAVAQSQRAAVLARYRLARAEEQRVVAALQWWERRQGVTVSSVSSGGRLLMPVRGWKSSDFGQRFDPYYRVWQLHAGMDIAAGGGTPIRAAADGRVIRAGWNGGYGKYTCISHGGRFTTCYGHQSRIGVRPGERVRRGEVIGRVGTTGASTGYHLHFETRVNGTPKNPAKYLPSCLC